VSLWLRYAIIAGILAVTVAAGSLYIRHEQQSKIHRISDELRAVSELKRAQLSNLYVDELNDIELIASNQMVSALYYQWLTTGADTDRERMLRHLASLSAEHGYQDLFICNEEGERYFPDSDVVDRCNPVLLNALPRALQRTRAICTDLYYCNRHSDIHLDFIARMGTGASGHRAVIVGRFSADKSILPIVDRWPTASRSAETYLARREGDSIRVLSNLRHEPNSALRRTYSIEDTATAVVKAARGRVGVMEAHDYRGVEVIAYVRPVRSTPWLLVAKIDRGEIFHDMYIELVLLAILILVFVLAVAVGVSLWYSRRQGDLYRAMFEDHAAVKLLIEPKSGSIVDANHAAAKYYGWTREQLSKMRIDEINTLPREQVQLQLDETAKLKSMHKEFRHRRADGSIRDVEVFAGALRIRGVDLVYSIINDVTEKKEAERSMRLLGRSVEQSPVTIVITNSEGEIEYVNPEFTRVTGFAPEEVLGHKSNVLSSGYHTREFYTELWGTILSGKDWTGEFRNKRKNGEEFWERAILSPVFSNNGAITHFLGIKTDITEEKKLLSELMAAKEKAEESDRLKSAFLANMSHEIRTPINSVVGFADLLGDPTFTSAEREEFTSVIRQRSYDLLNIIDDILDISRIEAGVVKIVEDDCDVREILQDLHMMFSHLARKKATATVQFSVENALEGAENLVVTDAARVRQVLTNLLSNAFKFTETGSIAFGCRRQTDAEILFYVSDTGIGIDTEISKYIFDRFRQADESSTRRYGGTGLGLAICAGIVYLLGGRIWVDSAPGRGSTFQFTIPHRRPQA
jgi:PAS domain S-box-containing protein